MRTLHFHWLCPFSRKIRLILAEKKLDFELELERYWERRPELMTLNPACEIPILVDLNGTVVVDSCVIAEYLDEAYPERLMIGTTLAHRAEVRRLQSWFDGKFAREVSVCLLEEKVMNRFLQREALRANQSSQSYSGPNSGVIRQAKAYIHDHLEYISWLVDRRKWLAGDEFSLADITAAAHLSTVDYLGDVPWSDHELAKDWYARLKSRPSFRAILQDRMPGLTPAAHYTDLDF